ncbi:cation transporter [Candidatus Poribacteria bacterium]|nr:cation transporter [Candidatus Poribacteria bacterium]
MSTSSIVLRIRAARLSLGIGIGMFGVKFAAYAITGSAAVLSDALESVVHVLATAFALYSVIKSAQPPDRAHPYGHGKIEFFSAGFEGAFIIIAALAIVYESGKSIFFGRSPVRLDVGITLTLVAGLMNLALGWYLIRTGKRTRSLTLIADGHHVLTDAYTSLGVVAGLSLVVWTGWSLLDPIVAIGVALNILYTGSRLVRESVSGLLHEAEEPVLRRILDAMNATREPEWIDVHHLRSWRSGERQQVDLHLTVPRYWHIDHAHEVQEEIESIILDHLDAPGEVIVHLDACVPELCILCGVSDCPVRRSERVREHPFTLEGSIGDPAHFRLIAERGETPSSETRSAVH